MSDVAVLAHKVTVDCDVSLSTCRIEAGELVLKGHTVTIGDSLDIRPKGSFVNEGGTLAPAKERFALRIAGNIAASGITRVRRADITFASDQFLSFLYSGTPKEDQLTNDWFVEDGGSGRREGAGMQWLHTGLVVDMDCWVRSIALVSKPWEYTPYFRMDAVFAGKPLTLTFADVPGCGLKSGLYCEKSFTGSQSCPITITSVNSPPANYFLIGDAPKGAFFMKHGSVSYSKGISASTLKLDNSRLSHVDGTGIRVSGSVQIRSTVIEDCKGGIKVQSTGGRPEIDDITIEVSPSSKEGASVRVGQGCLAQLSDGCFDMSKVSLEKGARIVSKNHNKTGDYWILGDSSQSILKSSSILEQYRFSRENSLHIKDITFVLDGDSQCSNVTIDAGAVLDLTGHTLTVHGKKTINGKLIE